MKIELHGLSKSFDSGNVILNQMDYCDEFQALAIIGPSGGGKSTLLRVIGGLIAPSSGTMSINGTLLPSTEEELLQYRRRIGFVFQQNGLFRHMTAMDNITVPLIQVHGYSREEAGARAEELLRRFGLLQDAGKRPSALSGGQQQRVSIARAIAAKPEFLLLDEPTSALDPEYTTEVLDTVNELKEEGMDFIIVTHEMGFARHACEKVAFLCNGELLEYGESARLFAEPKTEELGKFLSKLLEWDVTNQTPAHRPGWR